MYNKINCSSGNKAKHLYIVTIVRKYISYPDPEPLRIFIYFGGMDTKKN